MKTHSSHVKVLHIQTQGCTKIQRHMKNYEYTEIGKHVKNHWWIIGNTQKLSATQKRRHTHTHTRMHCNNSNSLEKQAVRHELCGHTETGRHRH